MGLPGDLGTAVLTGKFLDPAGNPMRGTVTIAPNATLTDATGDVIIPQLQRHYQLFNGSFTTAPLVATDNTDINPSGWTYVVTVALQEVPSYSFNIALPSSPSPVDLSTLSPAQSIPELAGSLPVTGGTLTGKLTLTGSTPLQIPTGAIAGDVLTSDASGNATWEAIGAAVGISDWINVKAAPYLAAGNGTADDTAAINSALAAANPGQTVYLPAGTYKISAPLNVPPCVELRGAHGGIAAADTNTTTMKGAVLQIASTFTGQNITVAGATWKSTGNATITASSVIMMLDPTAGGWPSYGTANPGTSPGIIIRDLFIDGQHSPAGVDGIAAFGNIWSARFFDIGLNAITGSGMIGYIYSISGTFYQPDGWHGERILAQNVTGDSFGKYIFNDCTFYDFHAQGGGNGGDGFNINQESARLVNCRAEFKNNSFTLDTNNNASSYAPVVLIGCTSDWSNANGINIINSSTNGSSDRAPIIIDGCQIDHAGTNSNAGGGGYAGISITGGHNKVFMTNTSVWTGTSPSSPQYGIAIAASSAAVGNDIITIGSGCMLNGTSAAISNDGSTTYFYVDPSVMTATGTNGAYTFATDPYESKPNLGGATIHAAGSAGGILAVTNTASAPSNPTVQIFAAASGDNSLGVRVTGDTSSRFKLDSAGKQQWGPGNATQDTNLYRTGTGVLATDGSLQANSGFLSAQRLLATGLTGASAVSRYVGATTSGAPASGTFNTGDFIVDRSGAVWVCTSGGSPGTWAVAGTGTFVPLAGGSMTGSLAISESAAAGGELAITNTHSSPSAPSAQLTAAAAADSLLGLQVSGDSSYRMTVDSAGLHQWGSGSATQDVALKRGAAGRLDVSSDSSAGTFCPVAPNAVGDLFLAPTGAFGITMPRRMATSSVQNVTTSGTVYLTAIYLPAGQTIGHISMVSGTGTLKTGGTHGWYVLTDKNLVVRDATGDQTDAATVWGTASTVYTLATTAGYVTTYSGLYYVGIMVANSSGTQPNMVGVGSPAGGVNGITPVLAGACSGGSGTSQTTPPATNGSVTLTLGANGNYQFLAWVT